MKPEWLTDPSKWRQRPLTEKLEAMFEFHCIGRVQSASALETRIVLSDALRDSIRRIEKLERFKEILRTLLDKNASLQEFHDAVKAVTE